MKKDGGLNYNPPWVDNDGRFPDDCEVEVWYPRPGPGFPARNDWQWFSGTIYAQVGDDEWEVIVTSPVFGRCEDGEMVYPVCYRDSSELRRNPTNE